MNKSGIIALTCLIFAAVVAAKPANDKLESGIVGFDPSNMKSKAKTIASSLVQRLCRVGTQKKSNKAVDELSWKIEGSPW